MVVRGGQIYQNKGDTWPKILKYNFEKYGSTRRAMHHKHFGIWQVYSWKDYYLQVKSLALGLFTLGLEPGDKLVIVGDNAPEWYHAELAVQSDHGIAVGVCPDLSPQEIKTIIKDAEARFAVVEDQEQVDKILQIRAELPLLKKVVYWNYKGLAHYKDPVLIGYRQVLEKGGQYEAEHPGLFERNVKAGKAEEVCALVYTSGTSGSSPKGVLHTYRSMRTGSDHYLSLDPWTEDDHVVPSLPPAWMPEQWFNIGCHLLSASTLNFAESPETQQRDIQETNPSIVFYGARLWESQAALVETRMLEADILQKWAYRLLMPIGYRTADLRFQKKKPGLGLKTLRWLADWVLFKPLKKSLGLSKARICYSSGAFLSPETFRFFHALNIPLKNLYFSTEGGPLTGAGKDNICPDTVGVVLKGLEVKITEQGEILYRQSGNFVEYYRDPQKTAEVFKEGWFHSGDCGFIREDSHLVFIDRIQDRVILKSGEKLTPQLIESRLKFSPYIQEAWVTAGPDRAYPSAVIVINYDVVSRWAGQRRVAFSTFIDLSQKPEVYELIKQDVERVNRTLPPGCRVKKFVSLYRELSPDEGELTRNRKLRRPVLEERYRGLLESIYHDQVEAPIEVQIRHPDGRLGILKTTLFIKSGEEAAQ